MHIFNDFIHLYSPVAKAYNPLGTNFWCQQKALITLPIRCKFKKRNLILYTFLMILYMYIAPGQGQTNPWGQNFDVNRKLLKLRPFFASLKKISLNSDFIYIFNVFPHIYNPGAGADNPLWTRFGCQQKCLVTLPICCKFKKISLKSDFIHIFACFYTCI